MNFLWYSLVGALGGLLGGMGMGGGTILIPLLTIIFGIGQHQAQALNLLGFIPMAVIALVIHFKNRLVDYKNVWIIIVTGLIFCATGSFIAKQISGDVLKRIFGGFLILLSIFQLITGLKKQKEK